MNPDAHALPPGVGERVDALLAEDNREAVVETVFRDVVGMTDEDLSVPDARIIVLAGQEHVADVLAPELFAQHVLAFLREGR